MGIPKGGIAFFDSGVGGLTVLSTCEKYLPNDVFYYYGDNHHAPYGNLPPQKIERYVQRAFRRFQRLRVQAAVIACNTATAVCIEKLRKKYTFPIIGAEPAILSAAARGGEIWVLTTKATADSARLLSLYEKAQRDFPKAKIHVLPCEYLAGEIETHLTEKNYDYTKRLPSGRPTALVLGCTHYIYIKGQLEGYYHCKAYDGNEGIANQLRNVLKKKKNGEKIVEKRGVKIKNWDNQPLSTIFSKILGFLTTKILKNEKKSKTNQKANKRSRINPKKLRNTAHRQGRGSVYFLGKNAQNNRKIYKQMFVLKQGGQNRENCG